MIRFNLDVVVTRGGIRESHHRVHAAVVDAAGTLRGAAGDPTTVACWRSCAKPFQCMPFVESGHFDELAWTPNELALACASHGGEPEHVQLAASMLGSVGLEEGDLACGPHEPLSRRGVRLHQQAGGRLTRLHNNCSGKHAAMLAFARTSGWPVLGYEKQHHPVQQAALEQVARWSDVPRDEVIVATDGCGVSTFGCTLEGLARAFAKLGAAALRGDDAPSRILTAMTSRPHLVGGTDRFDTVLMEETAGGLLAKVGSEGVHCVAVPGESLGIAVKIEDGSTRAQPPATLRLLQHLGALPAELAPRLASFLRVPIQNTRSEVVGSVQPVE
jgi:L-asparaginase II